MRLEETSIAQAAPQPAQPIADGPRAAFVTALAASLAACGGGGGGGGDGSASTTTTGVTFTDTPMPTAEEASRFLAQSTLGASRSDIDTARQQGAASWIERQFLQPQEQGHYEWLLAAGYGAEANRDGTNGLDNTIWRRFITGRDALRQRMVLALSEICVVSVLGVETSWRQFAIANYLDILERNAFGNYRNLLSEISLSTAMGYYLTFRGNAKANSRGGQPDENYARELMQLFTIGLVELNMDGTLRGGGAESYGAADVSGLARVFTGWDLDTSGLAQPYPPEIHRRPMTQVATRYETGAKTFLGHTIAAGTSARAALEQALDVLFQHPNVPPFISKQLIQRLVTSNPSPAYVGRVAAVFANNGSGVRGDLKAVLRAILLDTEARDLTQQLNPRFGKLREPAIRFMNWARAFGAGSPSGLWPIGDLSDASTRVGQSPMRSASVFNFFRPGYVPPGSPIATAGLAAPEFQITNETSVVGYLNFMQRAVAGSSVGDVRADYTRLLALASSPRALLDELNLVLAAGQIPATTISTLQGALQTIAATTDAGRLNRVHAALVLVLAAPEYVTLK